MAQHVGFYEVITDENKTVTTEQIGTQPPDTDESFTFTPPANTATDNPAVLSFMVTVAGGVDMHFVISLNGTGMVFINENKFKGFWQEVLDASKIKPGMTNTLECKINSGKGTVTFSDMVIWYQRNI
jgi:hypothetical protein